MNKAMLIINEKNYFLSSNIPIPITKGLYAV